MHAYGECCEPTIPSLLPDKDKSSLKCVKSVLPS